MSYVNKTGTLVKTFQTLEGGVFIHKISNTLYDVFIGKGFKHGARVKLDRQGKKYVTKTWGIIPKNVTISFDPF